MSEGTPENRVTYFTVQGHSHDGVNSTKIDFSGYDLFDFISEGDLERLILSVVDSNPIRPRGGIIIEADDGSGDGVFIGPDVPGPATGLASTCSINEDGASVRNVTWDKIPRATSYLIQLHRSIDGGSNYLKVQEVETKLTSHAFEAAPMASSSLTRYKLIVQGQSDAGILGLTQTISSIQPCVDAVAPAGPKFEDSTSSPNVPNHLVSFRGFLARLQEQTEADTKWGIGEFEYSVSTSIASEGQWVSNQAESGRQTGRIISVTGLATGTAYYLRVRAIDNSNNASPWTYWNGTGDDGDSTMSNADSFTPAEITGTEITSNSITTSHIQANQIVSNLIAADQITANEIAANAVEADHIKANELFVGVGIQSNSYSAGSAGFKINYDGTAEFNNNVTMKGATISDSSLTVNSSGVKFRVTTSGNTTIAGDLTVGNWTSSSGTGLNWSNSAGELSIRGVIGIVGGWTIDANSMYIGGKTTSGFATAGITLNGSVTNGSLHSKNFYINSSGDAYFRGLIEASTIQTSSSGSRLVMSPLNALPDVTVDTGTLQAGDGSSPFTQITLKSGSSNTNDYYNDLTITLTGGPGNGEVRIISDYDGLSKVATVSPAWTVDPTSSTTYTITRKTDTFLRGYTGKSTEDYPGFIYYYGERDGITHSRQWGRAAFSSPRFSATIGYSGFNFSHSDDGWGELTFGLPHNAHQFVIADAGSGSTPTNTFNRGGITIVDDTPAATGNTLYSLDVGGTPTLYWNGSAIGGGSGMDSWWLKADGESPGVEVTDGEALNIAGGSNIAVSRVQQSISISGTYSASSPITLNSGDFGFAWPSSTNLGITGYTTNDSLASSILVKSATDNTAAACYWFDIADLNISKFYNDAGYTTIAAGVSYGFMTASSSHNLTNKTGNISQWTNDSGYAGGGPFLALSGGTMSGALNVGTGTKRIEGGSGGGIMIDSSGSAYLRAGDESNYGVTAYSTGSTYLYYGTGARVVTSNTSVQVYRNLMPSSDNSYDLGLSNSSGRWRNAYFSADVYTHDGGVETSDASKKTDVVDATLGLDFVKGLRPVSYKWIEAQGRAGVRTHQGFIAQEVEALLGSDAASTGIWCNVHQPAVPSEELGDGETTESVEESYTQALRYTELIPVLTKAIQELEARVAALEA